MRPIVILILAAAVALEARVENARLRLVVSSEESRSVWARFEVRDASGKMYQPDGGAILDRTARNRPETLPFYTGHFVARGEVILEVPPGEYRIIAERGLEYTRVDMRLHAAAARETAVRLASRRWIDMARRGWWSADFHVHRPMEDVPALLEAEDLNFAVVFTMWNKRNLWEGRPLRTDPVLRPSPRRRATIMNAEDERGGGAWMLHNLRTPLALGVDGRWFPQGRIFVEQARAQGAWFDMEKPFWWEVPIMMALAQPDSWGVLNNHFDQYGIHAAEAWGRARDQSRYPGPEGFVGYCLDLYYRYLNLGFKLPASAGSASGVLPNPVGQNRVYAYTGRSDRFEPEDYYAAMRRGNTFATNGPMLFFRVQGRLPGQTVPVAPGARIRVELEALGRDPIDRIELVANGKLLDTVKPEAPGKHLRTARTLALDGHSWLAARCFLTPGETIRLAHTTPVYLSGQAATWDARADARYFVEWLDELLAATTAEKGRFANNAEREQVIEIYRQARAFYLDRTR